MTLPVKTASLNPLSLKERMKVPRQQMPEQLPQVRATNFTEVNLGYSAELARQEALRCLECAKPACTNTCPVGVKVREFIQLIVAGDFLGAAAKIREDNVLPAITGRVCPQEDHCECGCLVGKKVQSLGIGYLERFVADYEQQHLDFKTIPKSQPTGKKVAIVGSGPSGLTAAEDLVQRCHQVRVFEALHEIGGVLAYGIPEFRLPKQIIREQVDYMGAMGVEFETDVVVGRTVTIDELLQEEGYDAVFIGTGAGAPQFMGIPGEHLNGVHSANEFLTRINLMHACEFPATTSRSQTWQASLSLSSAAAIRPWTGSGPRCVWGRPRPTCSIPAAKRRCPLAPKRSSMPGRKASTSGCLPLRWSSYPMEAAG